jgi:hypothetical protein
MPLSLFDTGKCGRRDRLKNGANHFTGHSALSLTPRGAFDRCPAPAPFPPFCVILLREPKRQISTL